MISFEIIAIDIQDIIANISTFGQFFSTYISVDQLGQSEVIIKN